MEEQATKKQIINALKNEILETIKKPQSECFADKGMYIKNLIEAFLTLENAEIKD